MSGPAPFTVDADIALGTRAAAYQVEHGGDVSIRQGQVPERLPGGGVDGAAFQVRGRQMLLTVPNGLRYLIEDGCRIVYARNERHSDNDLLLFLLGSAWAALCYQRGLIPLHAGGVLEGGTVTAFTGQSGAGKSTLVAALSARGRPFFTDDLLVLDPLRLDPMPACYGGQAELKLWGDAIALTGSERGGPVRDAEGFDKYYVRPHRPGGAVAAMLARLFVLERDVAANAPLIERLDGADAVIQLAASLYRPRFAAAIVGRRAMYEAVAAVGRRVPVLRFRRAFDAAGFDEGVDHLDRWLAGNA